MGIDPSRSALQVSLLSPLDEKPHSQSIALSPAAVNTLEDLLGRQPATIAMEGSHSTGQLFVLEMLKRGHDIREVHPFVSKRFREALSEDHTDSKDAEGLAHLALWKQDLPSVRFSEAHATYKRLSRLRQQLVEDRTRYLNRLHATLSETYGAVYREVFHDISAKKALRFFQEHPTINDVLAGGTETLSQAGTEAWEQLKKSGAWRESTYLQCLRTEVRALIAHVLSLKERVIEVEKDMARTFHTSDLETLLSMPQLGVPMAMTIVGNSGDISRFGGDVDRYVAYAGLAPAIWQSGSGRAGGKARHRYNRCLKNAFMYMAFNRMRVDQRAREYYQRKRKEGKRHWAAIRALARHMCRLVFRILDGNANKHHTAFQPSA